MTPETRTRDRRRPWVKHLRSRLDSAYAAVEDTIAQDGGTFRIGDSGNIIEHHPTTGYAVGTHQGTFRTIALGSPWTLADAAAGILAAADTGAQYVGTWIDDGRIHVDPIALVDSLADAITLGIANRQRAIWSFADAQSINLDAATLWCLWYAQEDVKPSADDQAARDAWSHDCALIYAAARTADRLR